MKKLLVSMLVFSSLMFCFGSFAHAQDAGTANKTGIIVTGPKEGGVIVMGPKEDGVIVGANAPKDGGVIIAAAESTPVVDATFLEKLANAALSKDWILLTGFLLVLLQYALRADWSPITKWVPWFVDTTIGGWVLNCIVSAAGALGLSAMKHEFSWAIVVQTLLLVATSTAVHHGLKDANGAKNGG